MKNLKKVLSLVLALAMALSLMTAAFAADASDYKDYSKVTYKEAVDVMTAAGIFNGGDGNNFNPDATLNREQAAKIITYMLVGQEKADKLTATIAPYADVAANRWSAGAIAYCTDAGIIAGDGNGRFNPTAPVLGTQFAKMLLVALGYDPKIEKLVGNEWAIKTAKLALSDDVDLDNGMEKLSLSDNLTREQAAQMAFNAMKATLVEYEDKGGDIIIGDITINNGATKATPVTSKVKADATSISDDKTADGYYTVEFAEKYCKDLKVSTKSADQVDSFGRPATTWVYDGSTVGTYADDADDSIVLNKSINAQKAIVTDSDYMNYSEDDVASKIAVYVNGDKQSATSYKDLANLTLQAGDEIETFENDDNEIETIAVLRYSLAQIDEIETKLSSTYTKQGASVSITLQNLNENGIGNTYYDKYDADSDKELAGYTSDYKEGDVLAVALKGGNSSVVLDSYVAESAAGKITKYNNGSKANISLDGTEMSLHAYVDAGATTATAMGSLTLNLDDTDYTVYTDKNGYVIGIDEGESAKITDVYYVTGVVRDQSRYTTYYAQAVSIEEGTVTEFQIKDSDSATMSALGIAAGDTWAGNFETVKGLFTFSKSGSSYTAKAYTGSNTYTVIANSKAPAAIGDDLAKDDTKMTVAGEKIYLNDTTKYVKVEDDGKDIGVTTAVGGTSAKKANGNNTTTAIAITKKDGKNEVASYVILVSDKFSGSSDDVVFVKEVSKNKVSYKDKDGDYQTGYNVELFYLDGTGKIENATVEGSTAPAIGFYTWDKSDDAENVISLDAYTQRLYDQFSNISKDVDYDDETGFAGLQLSGNDYASDAGLKLTGVYNNALSAKSFTNNKHTVNLSDVDFADKVIVADNRDKDDRDADVYTSEITSVSQLKTAIDRSNDKNGEVKAVVFYDDGEVTMVYVLAVADAGQNGDAGNKETTATVTGVKAEAGTKSGELKITVNAAKGTVDTKASVTLYVLNNAGTFTELGDYTVTIAKDATFGDYTVTGLNSGVQYKVVCGAYTALGTAK